MDREMQEIVANVLVVGDSWASAFVGDTKVPDGGWPLLMGVPKTHRQAVAGTTAQQWSQNHNHMLNNAMLTKGQILILSLMGNDMFAALKDGTVTLAEMFIALTSMRKVVSTLLRRRTFVFLYSDPYWGEKEGAAEIVAQLNGAIQAACLGLGVEFFDTAAVLRKEHFDGVDIHPNTAGQKAIADGLMHTLKESSDT